MHVSSRDTSSVCFGVCAAVMSLSVLHTDIVRRASQCTRPSFGLYENNRGLFHRLIVKQETGKSYVEIKQAVNRLNTQV